MHNSEHYAKSYGSEMETPRRAVSLMRYKIHHQQEAVDVLLAFNFYLCTCICYCIETRESSWKVRLRVYCLLEGLGVSLQPLSAPPATTATYSERSEISLAICWYYCTNCSASCLDNCKIVLYNSFLLIVAVIFFSILVVKLRPGWFNVAWGCSVSWWALVELLVLHLCLSCFIWSVVHFSLVCFALELSILE